MSRFTSSLPPLGGRRYDGAETLHQLRRLMSEGVGTVQTWSDEYRRACRAASGRLAFPGGTGVCRAYRGKTDGVDAANRTIACRIGSAALDRYRTVIDPEGIELSEFGRNPVILWEHGRDAVRGAMPVGRAVSIGCIVGPNGPELIARAKFFDDDPFAERLYQRYKNRDMSAWSVNVIPRAEFCSPPTRDEIRRRPELADCEMMFRRSTLAEFSCVSVGGNAQALTIDGDRSFGRLAFAS